MKLHGSLLLFDGFGYLTSKTSILGIIMLVLTSYSPTTSLKNNQSTTKQASSNSLGHGLGAPSAETIGEIVPETETGSTNMRYALAEPPIARIKADCIL